ncbi:glycosyltransferase family 1 protein [Acetobacteraceae bacterium B3987]|nr:glycosyltransferase family 1 protein [Acetobacteraceae bacterium B3987]
MNTDGTFFEAVVDDQARAPVWCEFDAAWYRRRYAHQLAESGSTWTDNQLAEKWQKHEEKEGTSPNRYFDEEWYLKVYPDVRRGVQEKGIFQSGFQHYADVGYQSCAGHWLFLAEYYLRENTDYSLRAMREAGYVNAYDHFLRVGDYGFRSPHFLFDAELFIRECLRENIPFDPSQGAFSQYLSLENSDMRTVRTSWYFDPVWYLERYPEVATLINDGAFISPLHHYMVCDNPKDYDPNPYFDESYYLAQNSDVAEAVRDGVFRNGYAHFIRAGIDEQRSPSADLDFRSFVATLDLPHALNLAHVDNPFLLWVLRQEGQVNADTPEISVTAANKLALQKVKASLPSLFRCPLRFVQQARPQLSVVLFSEGNYLLDIATLTSLHTQGIPDLQVIVVGTGNALSRQRLDQAVEGLQHIVSDKLLSQVQQLQRAMPLLAGERILLLESGVQLLPMALPTALTSMMEEGTEGTGKLLTSINTVLETGSAVWRDGSITCHGRGEKAQAQSVSFQRIVEAVQGGMLFCHRKGMEEALHYLDGYKAEPFFSCFSIALRAMGKTLSYWPTVQAKMLNTTPESYTGRTIEKDALRRLFPVFLPGHAIAGGGVKTGKSYRPLVMMVFPHLPRLVEGGPTQRIMQQIEAFRWLGWRVLVVGLDRRHEDRLVVPHDYPADVECWRGIEDFSSFLREWQADMKMLWLSGTQVLSRLGPILATGDFSVQDRLIVLDIVNQDGTALKAAEEHLRRLVGVVDEPARLMKEAQKELEYAWLCQGIVTGDEQTTALLHRLGYGTVTYLPYAVSSRQLGKDDEFSQRQGILFPLSIYRAGDAGHDGFDWFCLSVMPYLQRHFDAQPSIGIGGYHHPLVDLGFYECLAPLDGLAEMDTLSSMMDRCRILMDPSRVLTTQATEILEAAGRGVPAVLNSVQMERLGWKDGEEALDGGFNDPQRFAEQIIRLYEEPQLWSKIRHKAHNTVRERHGHARLHEVFGQFIETLLNRPATMERPFRDVGKLQRRSFAPAPLRIVLKPSGGGASSAGRDGEELEEGQEDEFMPLPTRLGVTLPEEQQGQREYAENE